MYLKSEQYQQIVNQLRSEQVEGRSSERRGSPRVGLRAQARVISCRADLQTPLFNVWVRDISIDGIGLLSRQAIDPGTFLVATLPSGEGVNPTLDLLYVVVRCEALNNGMFSVGARLQRVITAEDMK